MVTLAPRSGGAAAGGVTIRPSSIRTTRWAAAATWASWVTRTMVWPPPCSRLSSSMTSWPPSESSAPVGSSASSRVGSFASARAPAEQEARRIQLGQFSARLTASLQPQDFSVEMLLQMRTGLVLDPQNLRYWVSFMWEQGLDLDRKSGASG